jgi:hypothetical protein
VYGLCVLWPSRIALAGWFGKVNLIVKRSGKQVWLDHKKTPSIAGSSFGKATAKKKTLIP